MVTISTEKNQAIELRKQGMTYSEIVKIIPVSKSLLSYWFKDLQLTTEEKERIALKMVGSRRAGVSKSSAINRQKRLNREIIAFEDAKSIFAENMKDQRFLIGVALYWAEGAKKHNVFQFLNSDPNMIIFMYNWIREYLKIEKEGIKCRLFIHKILGYENVELFWAGKLGLEPGFFKKTIYKPTKRFVKKNPDYKGCLRLSIADVYVFRLMRAWQKLLIQYYGNMPSW